MPLLSKNQTKTVQETSNESSLSVQEQVDRLQEKDSSESSFAGSGHSSSFSDPVPIDPKTPRPGEVKIPPVGTAKAIVQGVDLLCTLSTWPLVKDEQKDLERDLAAVLIKYDVPNVPVGEEMALLITSAKIAVPRIMSVLHTENTDSNDEEKKTEEPRKGGIYVHSVGNGHLEGSKGESADLL